MKQTLSKIWTVHEKIKEKLALVTVVSTSTLQVSHKLTIRTINIRVSYFKIFQPEKADFIKKFQRVKKFNSRPDNHGKAKPISDQKGSKDIPFGAAHSYIAYAKKFYLVSEFSSPCNTIFDSFHSPVCSEQDVCFEKYKII